MNVYTFIVFIYCYLILFSLSSLYVYVHIMCMSYLLVFFLSSYPCTHVMFLCIVILIFLSLLFSLYTCHVSVFKNIPFSSHPSKRLAVTGDTEIESVCNDIEAILQARDEGGDGRAASPRKKKGKRPAEPPLVRFFSSNFKPLDF